MSRGGFGPMGGFHAMPISGPESVVELVLTMMKMEQKDHHSAVAMATAIREAIITMVCAMALVTNLQSVDNPIIAITQEECEGGVCVGHTPEELLGVLADGYPTGNPEWDNLVKDFQDRWSLILMEDELKEMPDTLHVSDILGEPKEEN